MAKAQYYRGARIATNTVTAELYEQWQKAAPKDKKSAKEKLDEHFSACEAEFKKHCPNWKPYPEEGTA